MPKQAPKKRFQITVRRAPGQKSRALVCAGGRVEQAAIGRSGITSRKREGDGATPLSSMALLGGYLRADRTTLPPTALPLARTRSSMLWCDAPAHARYNRPVSKPFTASHEELMRSDGLYDVCLVMDWNISARGRNRGSAIFFHLNRPGYLPTEGCIAVSLPAMKRLIRFMRAGTRVVVVR
ncbi:MAG: L,D-transpeptidase family protein [Pararhizobium sp.]|nr:L,D-transpeptidase family protein [Pararhizobium sp.]MDO9416594.1 L,D-transpeptidase family protein [Pararhizobium sp.]